MFFLSCNDSVSIYFFTLFVCSSPLKIRKIRHITHFKKNVSLNNLYIFDIYKYIYIYIYIYISSLWVCVCLCVCTCLCMELMVRVNVMIWSIESLQSATLAEHKMGNEKSVLHRYLCYLEFPACQCIICFTYFVYLK